MQQPEIGQNIKDARLNLGLTQVQLADKCRLDIRTIQRIETGKVHPRFFTMNLINEVLGTNFEVSFDNKEEIRQLDDYIAKFRKRRMYRMITFFMAIFIMVAVVILAYPSWILFGLPKQTWAPFFYLIMFAHLIGIGLTWRCPSCGGLLGDVFNTRYCSKCGLNFYK